MAANEENPDRILNIGPGTGPQYLPFSLRTLSCWAVAGIFVSVCVCISAACYVMDSMPLWLLGYATPTPLPLATSRADAERKATLMAIECSDYLNTDTLRFGQLACLQGPLLSERDLVDGGWLLYFGDQQDFIKAQAANGIDSPPHIPQGGCVQVVGRFSLSDGRPVLRVEMQGAVRPCD